MKNIKLLLSIVSLVVFILVGCAGITHEDGTRKRELASQSFQAGEEFQWTEPEDKVKKKSRKNLPSRYRYDDY